MKLRKGDQVMVLTGKDKGKTGRIEAVLPDRDRVVITGVNLMKKAIKASGKTKQAGIVDFPAPLHVSNVNAIDPKTNKPTRIGYKFSGTGKTRRKIRIAKKSGQELNVETA